MAERVVLMTDATGAVGSSVIRAGRGENLLSADRTHLYQRLVFREVPHRTVTLIYGGLAIVGVLIGNAVAREVKTASLAGAFLICALAAGLWLVVIWRERAIGASPAHVSGQA